MAPRYGIVTDKAIGVPMARIQAVAKALGRDHALAAALWETGVYEARMVACMIDDPAAVTPEQMDRWRADFDNWAIVDTVCFKLFDRCRTPSPGSTPGPPSTTSSAAAPPSRSSPPSPCTAAAPTPTSSRASP